MHAENAYRRDHGKFIACAPSGAAVPRGDVARFDAATPGWKDLGFALEGAVRFRYEVTLEKDSFVAIAHGDLNGDGKTSTFSMRGDDFQLHTEDELE